MSRFTPEEIARIRAQSERLLREPAAPPATSPAPPPREAHVPESDPIQEWRDWHDARDRGREAARAQLRRETRDAERARGADWWAAIEAHIEGRIASALAERQHEI